MSLVPTRSATQMGAAEQTKTADATANAPAPTSTLLPTSTPLPDGTTCFVNRTALFTLKLAPGWHTDTKWDERYNTMIYNYESVACRDCSLLPDRLKIDISVIPLADKSFEQWVSDERVRDPNQPPTIKFTESYPYTIGKYQGVAYTATGYGDDVLLVHLHSADKVISIGLLPAQSSALNAALSLLATLDISDKDTCA